MRWLLMAVVLFVSVTTLAQRPQQKVSVALTNSNTATPFGKFAGLFTDALHPGVRVSYGFNWRTKPRHDWFQQLHAGYFFHRYLQHAVPLYTDFGYRYKFSNAVHVGASIGAGYMHSIPATAVLEQNEAGEYENGKGAGRSQVIATVTLELRYSFSKNANNGASVFFNYQQLIQAPFIKSYVPLLPYNGVALGISLPIKKGTP